MPRAPRRGQRNPPKTALTLSLPCSGVTSEARMEATKTHLRWPLPVLQSHGSVRCPTHNFPLLSPVDISCSHSLTPGPLHMLVPPPGTLLPHPYLLNPRFLREASQQPVLRFTDTQSPGFLSPHSTYLYCAQSHVQLSG